MDVRLSAGWFVVLTIGLSLSIRASEIMPEIEENATPKSVWAKLAEHPVEVSSSTAKEGVSGEEIALVGGVKSVRRILDVSSERSVLAGGYDGIILTLHQDDSGIVLRDGVFVERSPKDESPNLPFVINAPLLGATEGAEVVWDHRTRHYVSPLSGGRTCRVALRTPSDSERWSCGWQEVSIWERDNSCSQEYRRIVVGAEAEHRLVPLTQEAIAEWVQQAKGNNQLDQSERLYGQLTARKMIYKRIGLPSEYLWTGAGLGGLLNTQVDSNADGTPRNPKQFARDISDYFASIRSELPTWMSWYDHLYTLDRAPLTTDDPAMRYWRSELIAGSVGMHRMYNLFRDKILCDESIPLRIRIEACEGIGNLGRPATLFEPFGNIPDRALCEAILFSRWHYPVQEHHIVACVEYLNSLDREQPCVSMVVETLVRLDELEQVSKTDLEAWWTGRTERGDSKRFLEVWDALCTSSRSPSGRRFLIKKLAESESSKLKQAILRCLRLRAESTLRTRRFDFMTQEECQQILALREVATPGRDLDGGTAPPFPTDE